MVALSTGFVLSLLGGIQKQTTGVCYFLSNKHLGGCSINQSLAPPLNLRYYLACYALGAPTCLLIGFIVLVDNLV